jgi:hypothetical protein
MKNLLMISTLILSFPVLAAEQVEVKKVDTPTATPELTFPTLVSCPNTILVHVSGKVQLTPAQWEHVCLTEIKVDVNQQLGITAK